MIAGLDSSFARPSAAKADEARAAGVGLWSGYLGTRAGLGLATLWGRADFDNARRCGGKPLGFCSGWDDPAAIARLGQEWDVRPCLDVESGIRDDGPWVQGWLDASGAGLYGNSSVHYNTGGRRAAFHVVAWYFKVPPACYDPGMIWPWWLPPLPAPTGWQFCGTHDEFGLSVDRGWYDDWFGGAFTAPIEGVDMTPEQDATLTAVNERTAALYNLLTIGATGSPGGLPLWGVANGQGGDRLSDILAAVKALQVPQAQLQPVLDAIAALKVDLDGLTLKKA